MMRKNYLLPSGFKKIGWWLLATWAITVGVLSIANIELFDSIVIKVFAICSDELFENVKFFRFIENGIGDELITIWLAIALFFVCFSKEKDEDECIAALRCNSLIWAMQVNLALVLAVYLFIYGGVFLWFIYFCVFTAFILYLVKFHMALYKFRKEGGNE